MWSLVTICMVIGLQQLTIASIREDILRKLNFDIALTVNTTMKNSTMVRNLIKKLEEESDDGMVGDDSTPGYSHMPDQDDFNFRPSSVLILASETSLPSVHGYTPLYFKLGDIINDFQRDVVTAFLNIHLPAAPRTQGEYQPHAVISVYQVSSDKLTGREWLGPAKEDKVDLTKGGWVTLDLLHLATVWLKHPSENLGVVVRLQTGVDRTELSVGPWQTEEVPYLQLDIRSVLSLSVCLFYLFAFITRSKRNVTWRSRTTQTTTRMCSEENPTTGCCMLQHTFDFKGIDAVVFPK